MIPVYRAGKQQLKVRALMIGSLALAAGCLWWGVDLAQTYGLNPGDGGVLAPLPQRLAWGICVATFGVAVAAGMWLYGRLYVLRIGFEPDGRRIQLDTAGFFGSRRHVIDTAAVGTTRSHRDFNDGTLGAFLGHPVPSVDAPWKSVRIGGRRLPLIIDGQGEVLNAKVMQSLFGGRARL